MKPFAIHRPVTRRHLLSVAAAGASTVALPALAQANTTRLLIAFPPGGPVDFVGRAVAEQLAKELGQTVVVENRAGANGGIAAEAVIKAPPDGQTLWLTSVGAVAINPALYEKLSYDPVRDLAPVSLVVNNVELLVVHPSHPASNGAEFVAWAKAKKGGATMASSGTGSVPHLAMELLADATKADLVHVPYKGAAPAITDVMAGHVDGFFGDIPGLIGFVRSGKLKAVGIAASRRHPAFPEVKTFKELGVGDIDSDNWYAIFTGKRVPAAEVDRINQALRRVLNTESVRTKLLASGAEPAASSPAELSALLQSDSVKWGRVISTKKIKPD